MRAFTFLLTALLLSLNTMAWSQDYPSRRLTIVVPFPAGSGPDVYARIVATRLATTLGQPVVIENRPGASGTIGARTVVKADPDGYTLLFGSTSSVVIAPALAKEPPFDPIAAFTPVGQVARGPMILSVRSDLPIHTLPELISYAKAHPGKLNYGTSGHGSLHHLATEVFERAVGIEMVHIPFPGGPQSWSALQAGIVDVIFDTMPGPIASLKAGKAKALAVTGKKRLADLPGIPLSSAPTFDELNIKDVDITFWFGVLAPADTPNLIVQKLNAALNASVADPELEAKFLQQSIEPAPGSAEEFKTFIEQQATQWRQVIDRLGAKSE